MSNLSLQLTNRNKLLDGRIDPLPDYLIRYKMDFEEQADSVNSPSLVDGIAKYDCRAIEYNGVDQYTNKNSDAPLLVGIQPLFSISLWVKPPSNANVALRSIIGYGTSANGGTGLQVVIPINASLLIRYISGTAGFNSTVALTPNMWNHVVFTINGTSRKCYVNNNTPNTNTNASNVFSDTGLLKIGSNSTGSSAFYQGGVDDVRIYTRELNATEVETLYSHYCNDLTFNGDTLTFEGEAVTYTTRA